MTIVRVSAVLACLMLGGCTLSPVPSPTQPSGVTQRLLIRSLERALAGLDIEKLKSQSVAVEVFLQAGPETFVREFIVTWLRAHGVRTASESPELRIKAFASVFGTDSDQTLFGMPAFQAPFMSIPVPEIAIFKWQKSRGQAELRLYEFDGTTDLITHAPPPSTGRAKLDKFTVLVLFGFTVTDIDQPD